LTPAEAKLWKAAKRKRGRPKTGRGFQRISVSMERGLLKQVTALAKKRRVSRSRLFAQVFEKEIANGS
jgi:predicted DNA-binding ribbon-helix-helix protein